MNTQEMDLTDFIALSLQEDIGSGDHSSLACIPPEEMSASRLLVKENGTIAGIRVAREVFRQVDHHLELEIHINDGDQVKKGDIAFVVHGKAISILAAERLVLNLMQRMSGIATYTHHLVSMIRHTKARLLDTRKTTPLLRSLEKEAVRLGGGTNHRFGLYDMIMLKDNHIDFAGGIPAAIEHTRAYLSAHTLDLKIEIETRSLDEVQQVLSTGQVDRIMLDNFTPALIREALVLINGQYETEASGGITESNIVEYAETGIDFISVGALTHSVKSLDLSLKAI